MRIIATLIGGAFCAVFTAAVLALGAAGFLLRLLWSPIEVLDGKVSNAELSEKIWRPVVWAFETLGGAWGGLFENVWG